MENISVLKKGGHFLTPKVSVVMEIGVFFSLNIREKGSFFKSGNADMSSLSEASVGTGSNTFRYKVLLGNINKVLTRQQYRQRHKQKSHQAGIL